MGVIYELLKLPDKEKKKMFCEVIRQESIEKLKAQIKYKTNNHYSNPQQ